MWQMVENNVCEMILFFVIGCIGSGIYLFLNAIFGGKFKFLDNNFVSLRWMAFLFVIIGGFVTLMYSLTFQESLVPSQTWRVLLVGIGWQGIIFSFVLIKEAEEGSVAPQYKDQIQSLQDKIQNLEESNREFMRNVIGSNT